MGLYDIAVAVGEAAAAQGEASVALGNNSVAGGSNSIAIGNGAMAAKNNQVVLGNAGQVQSSTAAQSGTVRIVTIDDNGTLGTSVSVESLATANQLANTNAQVANFGAATASNATQINSLRNEYNRHEERLDEAEDGIAMALSMETPVIPSGKRYAMAFGTGYYNKSTAVSASFAGRVNDSTTISAGAGIGADTGKVGARGGVSFAW